MANSGYDWNQFREKPVKPTRAEVWFDVKKEFVQMFFGFWGIVAMLSIPYTLYKILEGILNW